MATRRKPHDPAQAALAAHERKTRDAEAKRLEGQGATVRRDRAGNIISAWRSNVFTLLLQRGAIDAGQHDAYERLKDLWTAWKGLEGKPEGSDEFVDNKAAPAEGRALVTDRMIRAGRDVMWITSQLTRCSRTVLVAFMVAIVEEDRAMHWRGVMECCGVDKGEIMVGEVRKERQAWAMACALSELQGVLQSPKERAA